MIEVEKRCNIFIGEVSFYLTKKCLYYKLLFYMLIFEN